MSSPSSSAHHPNTVAAKSTITLVAEKGIFVALGIAFLWFGRMKFTMYEAEAIQGFVSNSPLLVWLNSVLSVGGVSQLIGLVEVVIGLLLITRFFAPRFAVIGAAGACLTFLITVTFFFSTPGVFIPEEGFLAISVVPAQFLLKDLVLLFASLWALGDSISAAKSAAPAQSA